MAMHIRDAIEADADKACQVVRRSITELCHRDHLGDAATLTAWLANKTPANMRRWIGEAHMLVAVDGEKILGVGAITGAGLITLNYVAPEARFQGVSKAVVQGLEAHASEHGLARVVLLSSATARAFYRSIGYFESGEPVKGFGVTLGFPMAKSLH